MDTPSDTERLQLVYYGQCLEGHELPAVRDAVVAALKLDEARARRLFSGRRVVLRRSVDVATAHRYIARFAMMGALVRAEAAVPGPPPAERPPAERPPAVASPAAGPALPEPAALPPITLGTPLWRRGLRWAGMALAGSVAAVLLGLLLGPGASHLWSDWPPASDAAPAWPAAMAPPAAPAAPAAQPLSGGAPAATTSSSEPARALPADQELPADMTPEAVREYRERYLPAKAHKAFAVSSARVHAWHAGAASEDAAREAALARCVSATRPGDEGCRVVDADGVLLE